MVTVDCDFPGGNVVVEKANGDDVYVRQDLRDTEGDWFYWCFRVRGAGGRRVRFHFTGSNVIGTRGPGVSLDGGWTWWWLGADAVDGKSFSFAFAQDAQDVLFSFGMLYVQAHLYRFLARFEGNALLRSETLCTTRKGRRVERLHVGLPNAGYRVLLTARHHCCEMLQSYVLEGALAAMLGDDDLGRWFQAHVSCAAIPFVDKDGVEDGDQGKNRKPRDHNRDYDGESVHVETRAIREQFSDWRPTLAVDLHCPHIRGEYNEVIYMVGSRSEAVWAQQRRFAEALECVRTGSLVYRASDNLPFGQAWNTGGNYGAGMSFARWANALPNIRLATTIEFPYANVRDQNVTIDGARAFGRDVAAALRAYLEAGD